MEVVGDDFSDEGEIMVEPEDNTPGLNEESEESDDYEEMQVQEVDAEVSFNRTPDKGLKQCNNSNKHTKLKRRPAEPGVSDEEEEIEESMMKFARFLERKGFITQGKSPDLTGAVGKTGGKIKDKGGDAEGKDNNQLIPMSIQESNSETTIYQPAVPILGNTENNGLELTQLNADDAQQFGKRNRGSTSSEELVDTSDEIVNETSEQCDQRVSHAKQIVSRKNPNDQILFFYYLD